MVQQIINFIGNYFVLILIVGSGLFNFAVRAFQKARVQQARRDAAVELTRQRQESMRTGRPVSPPHPQQGIRQEANQDESKERIEALRKERMDQLRALREKRAGASVSPAPSQPGSVLKPAQTQQQALQQALQQARQQTFQQTQRTRPQASRTSVPQAGQARRPNIVASPPQAVQQMHQGPTARRRVKQTQSKPSTDRQAGHVEILSEASNPSIHENIHGKTKPASKAQSGQAARSMLRSRSAIRQAMILREVLDTPIGLRDQEISSGSLF